MKNGWPAMLMALMVLAATPPCNAAEPSQVAQTYLDEAIGLIRLHHRHSAQADWPTIIDRAQSEIGGAVAPEDTYPAIRHVLSALNERHSFLVARPVVLTKAAGSAPSAGAGKREAQPLPSWKVVDSRFGAVRLTTLDTLGEQGPLIGSSYIAALRDGLTRMDQQPLCGWIIDLRQNGGGNMWPMLRGLDPLLGDAPFGYFVAADGSRQAWVREKGNIFPTSTAIANASPAYMLAHKSAPVALLIGPATASSGEMTAIALIGRRGVRTFGAPSAGLTSANVVYPLSDGAFLVLTETSVGDRTGHVYSGPIIPDEQVALDRAEEVALSWLNKQCL